MSLPILANHGSEVVPNYFRTAFNRNVSIVEDVENTMVCQICVEKNFSDHIQGNWHFEEIDGMPSTMVNGSKGDTHECEYVEKTKWYYQCFPGISNESISQIQAQPDDTEDDTARFKNFIHPYLSSMDLQFEWENEFDGGDYWFEAVAANTHPLYKNNGLPQNALYIDSQNDPFAFNMSIVMIICQDFVSLQVSYNEDRRMTSWAYQML